MRIHRAECTGLIIDMQERLFPHMHGRDALLKKCLMLIEGLKILGVPLTYTEQYPKGLGPTLEPVREALSPLTRIEKAAFSCCDEPSFQQVMERSGRKIWIIAGIEAHVCVLQTVIDLREAGFLPVVVADATSSRNPEDQSVAMDRFRQEGAIVTTCESILFELARISGTQEFKSISKLVK
ncbi:MAG: hydrolase [Bacteroidales bacterium]